MLHSSEALLSNKQQAELLRTWLSASQMEPHAFLGHPSLPSWVFSLICSTFGTVLCFRQVKWWHEKNESEFCQNWMVLISLQLLVVLLQLQTICFNKEWPQRYFWMVHIYLSRRRGFEANMKLIALYLSVIRHTSERIWHILLVEL